MIVFVSWVGLKWFQILIKNYNNCVIVPICIQVYTYRVIAKKIHIYTSTHKLSLIWLFHKGLGCKVNNKTEDQDGVTLKQLRNLELSTTSSYSKCYNHVCL